jgi:NADH:ubiquinone oxidoreductase subunit 6 (subunit J)
MVAFVFLSAMILFSAWRVATTPLITHAALFLATTFAGVAGMFFLLQADFLAAVQLLVYAGAVMTVVIFAIMLSEMRDIEEGTARRGFLTQLVSSQFGWLPLAGAVLLFVIFMVVYVHAAPGWPRVPLPAAPDSTQYIASAIFGVYALPFEVASVLLLAAMVGAIVLTRHEGGPRA